ncbi:MAG TPA: hypothetical protein VGX91_00130, partial [Candidatus Cybelea sp.]|nr:hypothetical protein [Candidatus Cybelea sp.]
GERAAHVVARALPARREAPLGGNGGIEANGSALLRGGEDLERLDALVVTPISTVTRTQRAA